MKNKIFKIVDGCLNKRFNYVHYKNSGTNYSEELLPLLGLGNSLNLMEERFMDLEAKKKTNLKLLAVGGLCIISVVILSRCGRFSLALIMALAAIFIVNCIMINPATAKGTLDLVKGNKQTFIIFPVLVAWDILLLSLPCALYNTTFSSDEYFYDVQASLNVEDTLYNPNRAFIMPYDYNEVLVLIDVAQDLQTQLTNILQDEEAIIRYYPESLTTKHKMLAVGCSLANRMLSEIKDDSVAGVSMTFEEFVNYVRSCSTGDINARWQTIQIIETLLCIIAAFCTIRIILSLYVAYNIRKHGGHDTVIKKLESVIARENVTEEDMNLAKDIVEVFERLLTDKDIEIPCSNEQEEADRHEDENVAKLYGGEYWNLVSEVENLLGAKDKQETNTN